MLYIRIKHMSKDPIESDCLSMDIKNCTFAGIYGSKKNKIFSVLAGLQSYDGDVVLNTISQKGDMEEYLSQIAVLTKESVVNTSLSVNDFLDLYGCMSNALNDEYEERKIQLLTEFGLQNFRNTSVNYLTEQNRKMLKLLSLFLKEHTLILIDTFVEGFHKKELRKIIQFLKSYAKKDRIVLIGSDDYKLLKSFSNKIILFE